jgi:4-amino-4-deoxy-L-arabinose transferase-like glycosyltransferase
VEREWREASDLQPSRFLIWIIFGLALALRLWNIGHGVPYAVGVDEPQIVERAVSILKTGSLNPHVFDYGGLYIYVQALVALARFLVGATVGEFHSLAAFGASDVYVWGRTVTALIGTATVFLVYQIGMRWWGARYALLAAALFAVFPPHVRESHYILAGVPMTFLVTLTAFFALRGQEEGTARPFVLAGVATGLAAATTYDGALALVMPLTAAWLAPGMKLSRLRAAGFTLAASIVAFLLAAPYTVLDLPAFLDQYARLNASYLSSPPGSEAPWITYLKQLQIALKWPGMLLLIGGTGLGVWRAVVGPGRARWAMATAFPLVYCAMLSGRTLLFEGYLMPLAPFACVLIAAAIVSGVTLLRRFDIPRPLRSALIALLAVAVLAPPAASSIGFNRAIGRSSTQLEAFQWMDSNVARGARVAIEASVMRFPDDRFPSKHLARLTEWTPQQYREAGVTYLISRPDVHETPGRRPLLPEGATSAYDALLGETDEVFVIGPGGRLVGPVIRIYRVRPSR